LRQKLFRDFFLFSMLKTYHFSGAPVRFLALALIILLTAPVTNADYFPQDRPGLGHTHTDSGTIAFAVIGSLFLALIIFCACWVTIDNADYASERSARLSEMQCQSYNPHRSLSKEQKAQLNIHITHDYAPAATAAH
jgi:hypothetical protein